VKVLVTGSRGFVGQHVVRALTASGHDATADADVSLSAADLSDTHVAAALIQRTVPDAIVHLAARVDAGNDAWSSVLRNNQLALLRVLEAVERYAPAAHVVAASSSAVYGAVPRERNPVRESEPTRPVTMYGASKVAMEAIAFAFAGRGVRVTVCRPFNTIGPGGDKRSALAHWMQKLARLDAPDSDGVFSCGPLETWRDVTDVRDVARGYVAILESDLREPVINLCSGTAVEGRALLDMLFAAAGVRPRVVSAPPRPDDILFQSGDPSRMKAATGWRPTIPLSQTIEDIVREQRHSLTV
jgi:GDP-4-dehydro-6-deoxy-D-mannose reductase